MTTLALLKKWRWHQIGREAAKLSAGIIGLVILFLILFAIIFNTSISHVSLEKTMRLAFFYLVLLMFWSIIYFFGKRGDNFSCTKPEDNVQFPAYYLSSSWYHARTLTVGIALGAIGPYCIEIIFASISNIIRLLFVRLTHLGEVVDYLLRNPRRVTLAEIEAEELPVFEKYIAPLINLEVCQLLAASPIGICICTPFKKFCLYKLGLISKEDAAG